MDDWFGPVVHNAEEDDEEDEDDMQEQSVNYKTQYRNLKRKLKFLIYVITLNCVKFYSFLKG